MTAAADPARPDEAPPLLGVRQSFGGQRWVAALRDETPARALLAAGVGDDLVAAVLAARAVGPDDLPAYLDPRLKDLLVDPSALAGMEDAVQAVLAALKAGTGLAVFGDYDVDGATSTALLVRFFRALGVDVATHIPDRMKEGYGPNAPALLALKEAGAGLVITVDCGIAAFEPLAAARAAGLDIVVLDHHKADARLPDASAVVNPNRLDDTSGQGHLAAVGVTFLFAVAVNRALAAQGWYTRMDVTPPDLMALLDLVALGTVCDVVPLRGVNRAFVVQGLKIAARQGNVGLSALARLSGVEGELSPYHLGYLLGPRVNAGGRVGEAPLGARLLSTEDADEAHVLALKLDGYNQQRKEVEAACLHTAIELAESATDPDAPCILVVDESFHPGVVGIVAGRLKERYGRPALVACREGAWVKGSARSVPGRDIGAAILSAKAAGLLHAGGGHAMAAGFTLEPDDLDAFQAHVADHLAAQSRGELTCDLRVDGVVTPQAADLELVRGLEALAPFGADFPQPVFVLADVYVHGASVVGSGHVRCRLSASADGSGPQVKAIAFRCVDTDLGHALLAAQGRAMHLAGSLGIDTWGGGARVQLQIEDGAFAR